MWVQSLGQEDPLEESMATHSNILAWRIPMDRGDSPCGRKESDTTEATQQQQQQPPGNLPNPGTEPTSLTSFALADMFFTTSTTW